jgi:hypothetical protein
MFRGSVLVCALLFSAPTLWQALVDQSISVEAAVVRFLIAIPVAAVLLGLVRMAMRKQPVSAQPQQPRSQQAPVDDQS